MKKVIRSVGFLAAAVVLQALFVNASSVKNLLSVNGSANSSATASDAKLSHVPGELLVAPVSGVSKEELRGIYKGSGGELHRMIDSIGVHHIKVPANKIDEVEAALKKNPKIRFVERNPIGKLAQAPNDPAYPSQYHLRKTAADVAWDTTTGSEQIPVAILDTGFDQSTNPDTAGKFLPGYNSATGSSDTSLAGACSAHGAWVAGTLAGVGNNGTLAAGVAWKNPIIPVVVFNSSCQITIASAASGITWAVNHGARVINMSWIIYWSAPPQTLIDAVNYAISKGVVLVAAAGNESRVGGTDVYGNLSYPQTIKGVLTVSATDENDSMWDPLESTCRHASLSIL